MIFILLQKGHKYLFYIIILYHYGLEYKYMEYYADSK